MFVTRCLFKRQLSTTHKWNEDNFTTPFNVKVTVSESAFDVKRFIAKTVLRFTLLSNSQLFKVTTSLGMTITLLLR